MTHTLSFFVRTGTLLGAGMLFATLCAAQAPAKPAAKPAAASKPAAKPAAKAPVKPVATLPTANEEQLAAANMALFGGYICDFGQVVDVVRHPRTDGYVDVRFGKELWTMKPVLSSTGALRLEDVKGRTLMLQIANKSMLMDVLVGRRLVDDCVHEKQREAIRQAANAPPGPSLLSGDVPAAASAPAASAALATAAASSASATAAASPISAAVPAISAPAISAPASVAPSSASAAASSASAASAAR